MLAGGRFALQGAPGELFADPAQLAALGVASPQLALLAAALNRRLGTAFDFSNLGQARDALARRLGGGE